jgi:tetratricopeptide (TPR) repeat protein
VGTIFHDQEGEGESAKYHYTFTNYFRCRNCKSAGPWEIADHLKLLGLALRARVDRGYEGLFAGRCALFDGTFIQTPAMGEEHLRALLDKDPHNAFLCTRLGNLLRGCREQARAIEWYEKALALDAGDIEARYHLYSFADEHLDVPAAVEHGTLLVRHLLQGRQTDKEELTEGIALFVVETLRNSPQEFRAGFLGQPATTPEPRERTFIRTVLEQEGDEDAIVQDAADRLLDGKAESPGSQVTTIETNVAGNGDDPPVDLVPSLKDLVTAQGLNARKLSVAVEADNQRRIRVKDRHSIPLYDGSKLVYWPVPSLRELFRGHRLPPPDMERYPPEYCRHFFFIEEHVLTVCEEQGDRTDQELEEIYSMLRRRPDGRSLGPMHDFLWQCAALVLGMHALSQAEHEAIFGQLERSVRKWALRPVSRNYVGYLRSILP